MEHCLLCVFNITLIPFVACRIGELLTIATCEFREEDEDAQVMFWENMNLVMVEHTGKPANFFGFMADEASANWNAVRRVFNDGKEMIERERSCLWHWEDNLRVHTQRYIYGPHQQKHREMCEKWRTAPSKEGALEQFRRIRAWWATGKAADRNIPKLVSWLSWWHYRVSRWGHFILKVMFLRDCSLYYSVSLLLVCTTLFIVNFCHSLVGWRAYCQCSCPKDKYVGDQTCKLVGRGGV